MAESMHGQNDNSQHTHDTRREGRRQDWAEFGIILGPLLVVVYVTIFPFQSLLSPHAFVHQELAQLAYGGASYAVAIAAAVLLAVLYERPKGILKEFLASLGMGLLVFPSMFGSLCIVAALVHLTGGQLDKDVISLGVFLWIAVLLVIFLLVLAGRKLLHR